MALLRLGLALLAAGLVRGDGNFSGMAMGEKRKPVRPACDACEICGCKQDNKTEDLYGANFGLSTKTVKAAFDKGWAGCKGEECEVLPICLNHEMTNGTLIPDCRGKPDLCVGRRGAMKTTQDTPSGDVIWFLNPAAVASMCNTDFCNHKCNNDVSTPGWDEGGLMSRDLTHVPGTHEGRSDQKMAFEAEHKQMSLMKGELADENKRRETEWKEATAEDKQRIFPKDKIIYTADKPLFQGAPYVKPPDSPEAKPQGSLEIGDGWAMVNKTEPKGKTEEDTRPDPSSKLSALNLNAQPAGATEPAGTHVHFVANQGQQAAPASGASAAMDAIFAKLEEQLDATRKKHDETAKILADNAAKAQEGVGALNKIVAEARAKLAAQK